MGRHSRKGPAPQGSDQARGAVREGARAGGRRRKNSAAPAEPQHHQGTPPAGAQQPVRGGHPEHSEQGGGRGEGRYGDWHGVPVRPTGPTGPTRPAGSTRPESPAGPGGPVGAAGPMRPPGPSDATVRTGPMRPVGPVNPSHRTSPSGPSGDPSASGPATGVGAGARIPGPRREFVEAFDDSGYGHPPRGTGHAGGGRPGQGPVSAPGEAGTPGASGSGGYEEPDGDRKTGRPGGAGKGRTFTGIAAAAVTTVLAVVVAGQVTGAGADATDARPPGEAAGRADGGAAEGGAGAARSDRSDQRAAPPGAAPPAARPTYAQLMAKRFPLDPKLKGTGAFAAVPGVDKAPGKGDKVRYRIDVEKGLALDSTLFARAVHDTLNDERSWAHNGAMTFERVSSGEADFVITLASPGTTGVWCAKSDLDTTVDNVSCDSAATERVMINAYRWAQGSATYGPDAMLAYRQMLINHEVGHRLGHNHVNCRTPGALAPVMQQQTKSLAVEGIECRPNPWVFPGG
ncbi:DUF3152 domain-containing protein [Streptomyces ficellus]|uniref:DUF3152 domain-containing protein n=1 Tax=Streptomyces ficellus TaxID=1977088 RepID=A0A6I6F3W3_9ACTN|nr:DUF3152 domain-containing protein [Streptomyces ficellus]QGV78703.1 DUF3152 domain-containing protein [Streptomyces ficellus]